MVKNKKAFILYEYNKFNDDFIQVMEYYNLKELQKKENIKLKNKKSIYHFITSSLDDAKQLLNNKYIIIREELN